MGWGWGSMEILAVFKRGPKAKEKGGKKKGGKAKG